MMDNKMNGHHMTRAQVWGKIHGLQRENARLRKQCRRLRHQVWFLRVVVVLMGCLAWLIG